MSREEFEEELAWGKQFERPAAEAFAQKVWPGSMVCEFEGRADIDFLVILGSVVKGYIEVKARENRLDDYPSTMLPERKHLAARFNKKFHRVPTYAVIVFQDTVASIDLWVEPDAVDGRPGNGRNSGEPHAFYVNNRLKLHPDLAERVLVPTTR